MNTLKFAKKLAIPLFVALAYVPSQALAQSILGADLSSFAVFGTSGVMANGAANTFTGGDVGSVTAITQANTSIMSGSVFQLSTAVAIRADGDLGPIGATGGFYNGTLNDATSTANGALAAMTVNSGTAGSGAGAGALALGTTFAPGVYNFGTGLLGAGETITLDGSLAGLNGTTGSSSVWVFRFATTLTTLTSSNLNLINVGDGANVGLYWSTGTSATLDADTWEGNVLALTTITSDGGLTMGCGRLLAGTAVTFGGGDSISTGCSGFNSDGFDQVAAIPEPETYALMLAGLGLMGFVARRRQRNLAAAA